MLASLLGKRAGVLAAGTFAFAGAVFALTAYVYSRSTPLAPEVEEAVSTAPTSIEQAPAVEERVVPKEAVNGSSPAASNGLVSRGEVVERPIPRKHRVWGRVVLASRDEPSSTASEDEGEEDEYEEERPPPLPDRPSRDEVEQAIASVRPLVQRCYDRGMVPGPVVLRLTVSGSGKVTHSSVSDDSSTATCLQQLTEQLQFPRFARRQITIRYAYNFR